MTAEPSDVDTATGLFPEKLSEYRERPIRDRLTRRLRLIPAGYPALLRWSGHRSHYAVRRTTDLVIDGYPRSANTFVTIAVAVANPRLHIAHHTHSVSQLAAAHRLDIPAIAVVREPLSAVASVRAGWPHWSPGCDEAADLRYWIQFHRRVLKWAPTARWVRSDHLVDDLAHAERELGWPPGSIVPKSGIDTDRISRLIEVVEQRRGVSDAVDRSSSAAVSSVSRLAARDRLLARVSEQLVEEAAEVFKQVCTQASSNGLS